MNGALTLARKVVSSRFPTRRRRSPNAAFLVAALSAAGSAGLAACGGTPATPNTGTVAYRWGVVGNRRKIA
jgi:hypothetical protein